MSLISKSARVLANHNQSTNASSSLFPPNAVYPSDHFFLYLLLHGITKLHFTSQHYASCMMRPSISNARS